MQPRLVAISYPSFSTTSGNGGDDDEKYARSETQVDTQSRIHSRLAKRLRKVSWQDLRSQLPIHRRKRSKLTEDVTFEVLQTCAGASSVSSLYRSSSQIDRSGSKWQALTPSIQTNILNHLEGAYSRRHDIKAHALRRSDLMAVQSSCRAWSNAAQKHLYETIQLTPNYDHDWYSSTPQHRSMRILQLRRTLRSDPKLANLVKHLVLLPENQQREKDETEFSDLVASVVMACPNLETLTSFYVLYTHNFNRFFHALSTRSKLTEHTWVIGEDYFVQSRAGRRISTGILSSRQTRLFLHHHENWKRLETLNVISHNGQGVLEHGLLIKSLSMLPSLKRLHISSLDANDFSDETLLALPPLISLRLDRCSGVTEAGLCEWAQSPAAANIQRLVLESQCITSLLTVSALMASLENLEIFRVVQLEFEPGLPLELDVEPPLFSSCSLKTLEWYVANGVSQHSEVFKDSNLPENMHAVVQKWSHSKSSQHFLSSTLDLGFPKLQKIILPGYGNLNGLLRWIRHTSSAAQSKTSPSQTTSTYYTPSSASFHPTKRNTSGLSLRPSSPTFEQYDHWRRIVPSQVAEAEIPENSNPHQRTISTPLSQILSSSSTHSPPAVELLSDADTDVETLPSTDGDAASVISSLSTPSPCPQSIAASSTTTVHSIGRIENAIAVNLKSPRLAPKEVDSPTRVPSWGKYLSDPKPESNSRQSSISILLDGYAYTA